MKAPYDDSQLPFEFWTWIAPGEWRSREVDYGGPDRDGCRIEVMINEDDFRHWLKQQGIAPSPRDAAVVKVLKAGRPPNKISWKEFCDRVRDDADGWVGDRPAFGFSDKQIRRVVKALDK